MGKKAVAILVLALLLLLALPALAGGWVVITLEELPTEVRAGEPVTLGFMVRQHGVRPIDGVDVVVRAEHVASGEQLSWKAEKGEETGYFTVEAVFPQAGEWTWQVTAEPFPQVATMPPLHVQPAAVAAEPASRSLPGAVYLQAGGFALLGIAALSAFARRRRLGLALGLAGALLLLPGFVSLPAPVEPAAAAVPAETPSAAEIGADLFQSKGCIACHQQDAIAVGGGHIGPNLSHYQPDPAFVRAWLRDPAAVRPATQMPNLGLDDEEIESLLAFLMENRVPLAAGREACPVTQPPTPAFEPPVSQGVRRALASEDHFWYGSPELWTRREVDGFWYSLPYHEHGYTQKQAFWSEGYNWREEQEPELVLSGRRLDGDERMADAAASNAYHPDYGSFIMTGFVLPAAGCWEITAAYKDATLSFVVWVEP